MSEYNIVELTAVANRPNWRWREEENTLAEESKLPQGEDVDVEEVDELGEAAGRVRHLNK